MLLMKRTAATETMMNRLNHRPMRGGVSRLRERFVSSAPGHVICRTGYLVAIMALSQKGMRNQNIVKGLEASVESASCHVEEVLEDLAPTPHHPRRLLYSAGSWKSRFTSFVTTVCLKHLRD